MRIITIIILVKILLNSIVFSQTTKDQSLPMNGISMRFYYNQDIDESFYHGNEYVTNKEYISYLTWILSVYGEYPDVFWAAFPASNNLELKPIIKNWSDKELIDSNFDSVLITLPSYIKSYVFNPKYQDEPIVGINYEQSIKYLEWLSDRYNENLLIRNKYLFNDPNQYGDQSFGTEAYMNFQYQGAVRNDYYIKPLRIYTRINWSEQLLRPAFRLPTYNETSYVINNRQSKLNFSKNKWLNIYWKTYIKTNNEAKRKYKRGKEFFGNYHPLISYYLRNKHESNFKLPKLSFWLYDAEISDSIETTSFEKILRTNGQSVIEFDSTIVGCWFGTNYNFIKKDSLGKMHYVYMKNNNDNQPLFVNRININKDEESYHNIINESMQTHPIKSICFSDSISIQYNVSAVKKYNEIYNPDSFNYNYEYSIEGIPFHSYQWYKYSYQRRGIKYSLKHGANINVSDSVGNTLLHIICKDSYSKDDFKTIKYLLRSGSDYNIKNKNGKTAYDLLKYRHTNISWKARQFFDHKIINKKNE